MNEKIWKKLEKWVRRQIEDSWGYTGAYQSVLIKMMDLEKEVKKNEG